MIQTGKYNELEVVKILSFGAYLSDGNEEILLPLKYVPEGTEIGNFIEVFIYNDNENRPIATTLRPFATVEEFAFLKVREVNDFGAFLDWGIAKDLFVPYAGQKTPMQTGNKYVVYIYIDEETGRITATSKIGKILDNEDLDLEIEDEVELIIYDKTDLGFKAIVNNKYSGLIYKNEVFEPVEIGDKKRAYIKQIREDNKIDLSLQKTGYEHIEDAKYKILHQLKINNGTLNLGDHSSPEEIHEKLKMSKKAFKKTIGGLYKDQLIKIGDHEIRLIK